MPHNWHPISVSGTLFSNVNTIHSIIPKDQKNITTQYFSISITLLYFAVCQKIHLPNGTTSYSRDRAHSQIARFSCHYGFYINGSEQITCRDGVWSHPTPICTGSKIYCIDLLDTVNITYTWKNVKRIWHDDLVDIYI